MTFLLQSRKGNNVNELNFAQKKEGGGAFLNFGGPTNVWWSENDTMTK